MAASGAPERQPRRGPAPIASFDHDGSDESSPETKQAIRLPEIREDSSSAASGDALAPPEQRGRSHSTPAATAAAGGLNAPAAPRIDISRASSSSHHDSRDSSPELALFAGGGSGDGRAQLALGFREDGALELRSSTEELAFLEPAPGEPRAAPAERRHSRKDSQGSEAALLAVSGRTSRLSSVGSQCSAHSALSGFSHASRVSRLSVVSGVSRSPSPHKMLLETSFCGPKPIETDPEICAAAVEERLLEMAKLSSAPAPPLPTPVDARDRREVRTEATVERASSRPASATRAPPLAAVPTAAPGAAPPPPQPAAAEPSAAQPPTPDGDKKRKETKNRARAEERRARPRDRRENREPEIRQPANRSKDIIRIKLKPDSEYEDDDEDESERTLIGSDAARKPASLSLGGAARPTELTAGAASTPQRQRQARDSRTPSPAGPVVSRKSSFCSLFKSRETIASPDSPSDALRRKKSLTEGRSRSRSRDRSATPTSAAKIRGSVLSLFRTPRKSATSPSPSSRDGSPVVQPQRQIVPPPAERTRRNDRLKYYEESKDGIIHIPLRTPPDELKSGGESSGSSVAVAASTSNQTDIENEIRVAEAVTHREPARPASAPQPRVAPLPRSNTKPVQRIVLPDGSIIIPLHSPTEKIIDDFPAPSATEKTSDKKNEKIVDAVGQSPAQSVTSPTDDRSTTKGPEPPPEVSNERSCSVARVEPAAGKEIDERPRRKEGIMFSTHVGSRDQVFSTQFSITKTPSVTSEISESFPSFPDEELRTTALRDTHIATASSAVTTPAGGSRSACSPAASWSATSPPAASWSAAAWPAASPPATCWPAASPSAASPPAASPLAASPPGALRDSSESEASSEAAPARSGSDVEQRGLVVQESFEEELPYVPTTLPLERSLALPMVPVRDRGGVRVAAVQRPRAAAPPPAPPPRSAPPAAAVPPPAAAPQPPTADKLRIRLPRRPRTTSASGPSRSERTRTRSGSEGYETRPKPDWIDFEEVPERRKQPKRIQTLPAPGAPRDVVFSYVEPEHCRCECHAHGEPAAPDELLAHERNPRGSPLPAPMTAASATSVTNVTNAAPFTCDLGLRDQESRRPH